jgi:hypothetical protein
LATHTRSCLVARAGQVYNPIFVGVANPLIRPASD